MRCPIEAKSLLSSRLKAPNLKFKFCNHDKLGVCMRPRPHYTVFKRKRYCFVPFSKRLRPHLSFPYCFRPSTLQRVSVLKTLLKLIFSYILPPFFLHYFPRNKLKLSHYAKVRPGLVSNNLGFWRASTESFLLSSFCPKLAS